jgi:hypothetical protein
VERIYELPSPEDVGAVTSPHPVRSGAAHQDIVIGTTSNVVPIPLTVDAILAVTPTDEVIFGSARDDIVTTESGDDFIAVGALNDVISFCADDRRYLTKTPRCFTGKRCRRQQATEHHSRDGEGRHSIQMHGFSFTVEARGPTSLSLSENLHVVRGSVTTTWVSVPSGRSAR